MYSISSSPDMFPDELHLTVSVVQYNTQGKSNIRFFMLFTYSSIRIYASSTGNLSVRFAREMAKDILLLLYGWLISRAVIGQFQVRK